MILNYSLIINLIIKNLKQNRNALIELKRTYVEKETEGRLQNAICSIEEAVRSISIALEEK
jgi:hypothetical protein